MANLINSNFNEKNCNNLQEEWTKQCQTGEPRFIQESWISSSKPNYTGVRDPNKQENNIQYRTYYQNKYNRDKNKRRNIYGSNTRDKGEQQKYKGNSKQIQEHDNPSTNKQQASKQ